MGISSASRPSDTLQIDERTNTVVNAATGSQVDELQAPYHRTMEEIEAMPVIDKTKTVCPECKLIIDGILYKDGDNVMIRKYCPDDGWTIEKYWEDYDMYMRMRNYNYYGRGFDNPDVINKGENCPFDCAMCLRHKSHSGLVNVVITNRCHLSCWYCFFYAKEGEPVYEPSKQELNKMFIKLRNQKPIPANALQITGGEPTMREDLPEIVTMAKEAGFDQIQLNTTGINLGLHPEMMAKLRYAGVSTLYMSFDGVSKRANPKNHWEVPATLAAARKANLSIVLVPTVIRTINDHELGNIINFALNNVDIVRAVNFQPVSLVGRMPARLREKQRITIPGAIKLIEKQTNGVITKEDWFSVPYVGGINRFIEALTGEYKYDLSIHFACGAGTYLFLDKDNRILPITRFLDAAGLMEHLQNTVNEMQGKSKLERRLMAIKALLDINKFIDKEKQPKSINFAKLLATVLMKHDFSSVGMFQMKSLFLGMMHFQDEYTYDIKRVEKCDIHYSMPDGRVLPFCTFNVFPEVYRDKIQRQYAIPSKEWEATHPNWNYAADKYRRDIKALEATPEYQKTYNQAVDFFTLPVNAAEAAKMRASKARAVQKIAVVETSGGTEEVKTPASEAVSDSEGGACGCGRDDCGCGGH
jgi:uncharacterized radical SAM superfamily Fe-S cluster-containing enzyme